MESCSSFIFHWQQVCFVSGILEPSVLLSPQGKRLFLLLLISEPCWALSYGFLSPVAQGKAHSGERKNLLLPQGQMTFASSSSWETAVFIWILNEPVCSLSLPMILQAFVCFDKVWWPKFNPVDKKGGSLRSPPSSQSLWVPSGGLRERACEWLGSPVCLGSPEILHWSLSLHLTFHNSLKF